jgi:hypothetical protein
VDGAQLCVLKQANKVSLSRLLQGQHRGTLESEIRVEILSNLSNHSLEWKLADEKFRRLLVLADVPQGHGAGAVAVLLVGPGGWGAAAGSLGGRQVVYGQPCPRWICGLFAWCVPCVMFSVWRKMSSQGSPPSAFVWLVKSRVETLIGVKFNAM